MILSVKKVQSKNVEVMMSKEDFERYMSTELKYFLAIGAHIKEGACH